MKKTTFLFYLATFIFTKLVSDEIIFIENDLKIIHLSDNIYVVEHAFPWPANSAIINLDEENVVIIDTPYTNDATEKILEWINNKYNGKTITAINTGYHIDNLGGNQALLDKKINIHGSDKTLEMIDSRGHYSISLFLKWLQKPSQKIYKNYYEKYNYVKPDQIFNINENHEIKLGNDIIKLIYPGETQSPDKIVVYIEKYNFMFGGCMILAGNKVGNIADANLEEWPKSISKLKKYNIDILIPGHGTKFNNELIDNTIKILSRDNEERKN